MEDHPQRTEIVEYMMGVMAAGPRRSLRRHFRHCQSCRRRLDAESALDERLRRGLSAIKAPARLLERIGADLEAQVGEEKRKRQASRRTWLPLTASGLAAALLLFFLVAAPGGMGLPWAPGLGWGSGASAGFHTHKGSLVCLGCARLHRDLAQQERCPLKDSFHATGFRSDDGQLWRFAQNSISESLMEDPGLGGRHVKLQARAYPAIQYLQVAAAQVQ
ncbi:MAG: hypothetical protein ACE5ID_09850 [Acidobacteriota bacterium]